MPSTKTKQAKGTILVGRAGIVSLIRGLLSFEVPLNFQEAIIHAGMERREEARAGRNWSPLYKAVTEAVLE